MNLRETQQTVTTLANASDLVLRIAQGVLGNDVADTFNGSPLSRSVIHNLAQTQFQTAIAQQLGAK